MEPTPQLHVDSRSRPWLCRLHQFALNLPETNNCHRAVTHCLQSTGSLPAHSLVLLVELAVLFFFSLSFSKSVSSFTLIPFFLHLTVSFCFSKFLIFAELKKEIKRSAKPQKIIIKKDGCEQEVDEIYKPRPSALYCSSRNKLMKGKDHDK